MRVRNVMIKFTDSIPSVTAFVLVLVLAGCVNPFDSGNGSGNGGRAQSPGTTSLVISFDTLGASTVAPDIANLSGFVSTFEVVLTSATYGTITVPGYASGNPITDIPADGNWDIVVNGRNGSGDLITVGEPTTPSTNPIDLSGTAGSTVAVTVELTPQSSGADGSLTLNLDYSAAVTGDVTVDTIDITLEERAGGTSETVTATGPSGQVTELFTVPGISDSAQVEVNFDTRLIQISDTDVPSGDYVLTITFYEGTEPYAPIVRAIQVYDYLESNVDSATGTGTITLAPGDLTSAPATPTDLVIEVTGDNIFDLYWNDTANTEGGYRIYAFDGFVPGTVEQIGGDLPANTQQFTGASPSFGNIDDLNIEVVAYNRFGESAPLATEFRSLPAAQFPDFNPATSVNSNDASWIALANPGNLEASTPVVGGADSMDVFVSTANNLNDIFTFPAPTATQGTLSYDLSGYGLLPGQTYYWRTQANIGTTRIVYPVRTFTVRDGNLHVDANGGTAGAAGSSTNPVDTIGEAVGLAESGEEIRVSVGTYTGAISFPVSSQLTLTGGWNTAFSTRNTALTEDGTVEQNSTSVNDTRVSVIDYSANGNSISIGSGPGLASPSILDGFYVQNDTGTLMTVSNSDVIIRNNVFVSYANGDTSNGSDIMAISGDTGATTVTENVFHLVDPSAAINQANVTAGAVRFSLSGDIGADPIVVQNNTFRQSSAVYRVLGMMSFTSGHTRRVEISGNSFALDHTAGGYAWAARMTGAEIITIENNTLTYSGTSGGGFDLGSEGSVTLLANTITYDTPTTPAPFVELRTGQTGTVDMRNNVYHGIDYGGDAQFVQTASSAGLNVDHNSMALTGTTAPTSWNLVHRIAGTSAVWVRNNIADGFGPTTGVPIYLNDAGGVGEIANNVFFDYLYAANINSSNYTVGTLNELSFASYNVAIDPQLDAGLAPTVNTPYRVRSGGVDLTGTIATDFAGNTRTAATGVTVGAYELDDARTLGRIVVAGDNGTLRGLLSGDIVDDGTNISVVNQIEVVPDGSVTFSVTNTGDLLRDIEAHPDPATRTVYWVTELDDGLDDREILHGADYTVAGDTVSILYELSQPAPNGTGAPGTDFVRSFHPLGDINSTFYFADLNEGVYRLDLTNTTFDSFAPPGGLRGGVTTDGSTLWFDAVGGGNRELIEHVPADNTGGTQVSIETLGTSSGRVKDMDFNGSRIFIVWQDTTIPEAMIYADTTTGGDGTKEIILDVNAAELSLDGGRGILYYSNEGTNSVVNLSFDDGFWGGTDNNVITLTEGSGRFDVIPEP